MRQLSYSRETLFSNIVCSVNHEVRSVLLLQGLTVESTTTAMRNALLNLVGNDIKIPREASFTEYCEQIFLPRNFVEKESRQNLTSLTGVSDCWKLSDHGRIYAEPSAALAIKAVNDFNLSLLDILGKIGTPNSKSRPAYNSAKILMKLYENGVLRERDLAVYLNLHPSHTRQHCLRLDKIGFIERRVLPHQRIMPLKETLDEITDTGKTFVKNFLYPIYTALVDRNYLYTNFRRMLGEYTSDLLLFRTSARKALEIYSQRK